MSYILEIESQYIKDYKTSKYKYKRIKNAIDDLLLSYDFFENIKIKLKISVINKEQIIILINFNFNFNNINKMIIINKEQYKLKTIEHEENDKNFLHEEFSRIEFENFNRLIPESNVEFNVFFNNKSHYRNIMLMSIY